jgi:hypothetical protein
LTTSEGYGLEQQTAYPVLIKEGTVFCRSIAMTG